MKKLLVVFIVLISSCEIGQINYYENSLNPESESYVEESIDLHRLELVQKSKNECTVTVYSYTDENYYIITFIGAYGDSEAKILYQYKTGSMFEAIKNIDQEGRIDWSDLICVKES